LPITPSTDPDKRLSRIRLLPQVLTPRRRHRSVLPEHAVKSACAIARLANDSMCGAHHMEKDKSAAECTRECVKKGTKYALGRREEDLHA